jgi:hypothetical protein
MEHQCSNSKITDTILLTAPLPTDQGPDAKGNPYKAVATCQPWCSVAEAVMAHRRPARRVPGFVSTDFTDASVSIPDLPCQKMSS